MSDHLQELPTPALLLDHRRLESNLSRMANRASTLGVSLRPHMKTAKSVEVARLGGFTSLTVSTLAEARYFAGAGFEDLLYAVALAPHRISAVADIRSRGADLQVLIDSKEVAEHLARSGTGIPAWIEIDCDGRRGGVRPDDPQLVEIGRILSDADLRGVLTHAGGSYAARTSDELESWARAERDAVVLAAARLESAGLPCRGVSVGSTPTATHARSLEGVTEMRPGVYMFGDSFQAGLGTCGWDDVAVSVLTTVIGRRRGEAIIDAGALALSLDRSVAHEDHGYGAVTDLQGDRIPGARVERVTQEHGIVSADLEIGALLRVVPNHACITAACHDEYAVIEGDQVVGRWQRCRGW